MRKTKHKKELKRNLNFARKLIVRVKYFVAPYRPRVLAHENARWEEPKSPRHAGPPAPFSVEHSQQPILPVRSVFQPHTSPTLYQASIESCARVLHLLQMMNARCIPSEELALSSVFIALRSDSHDLNDAYEVYLI